MRNPKTWSGFLLAIGCLILSLQQVQTPDPDQLVIQEMEWSPFHTGEEVPFYFHGKYLFSSFGLVGSSENNISFGRTLTSPYWTFFSSRLNFGFSAIQLSLLNYSFALFFNALLLFPFHSFW